MENATRLHPTSDGSAGQGSDCFFFFQRNLMGSDLDADRSIDPSGNAGAETGAEETGVREDLGSEDPSGSSPAGSWVGWFGSAILLLAPFAFFGALVLLDGLLR